MHVAINAAFWNQPNTGSGQYTRQLVYHLNRLVSDLTITLVFPQVAGEPGPEAVPPSVKVKLVPVRPGNVGKVWFEQWLFPRVCREVGATVAHVPYWGGPLQSPVPLVVTVHDLTTLLVPEYRRPFRNRLYNALVSASARGATRIITDSEASKQDIVSHLHIPADKIERIYLAAGSQFSTQDSGLMEMAVLRKRDRDVGHAQLAATTVLDHLMHAFSASLNHNADPSYPGRRPMLRGSFTATARPGDCSTAPAAPVVSWRRRVQRPSFQRARARTLWDPPQPEVDNEHFLPRRSRRRPTARPARPQGSTVAAAVSPDTGSDTRRRLCRVLHLRRS